MDIAKQEKHEFRYEWNGVLLLIVSEQQLHRHDIITVLEKAKLTLLESL